MKKLANCSATHDCFECIHYEACQKRARIRRLRKRAKLAVFYVLCPFVWMIDFICKIFTSKTRAGVALTAVVIALALSGFSSSATGNADQGFVVAATPQATDLSAATAEVNRVEISQNEKSSPSPVDEEDAPLTISAETLAAASQEALTATMEAEAIKAAKEEEARQLAAAKAEAERQAALEADANRLWENIFVGSQEIADQMGLPIDYDPILAMYGMRYLVEEEGFSVEGAAGLMGNVYSECKFVLDADNGSHFGIFQWDYYDRWPRISAYLEENGVSHYSRHQDYSALSKEEECELFVWQLRAALHSSDAQYYSNTIANCKVDTSASSSADRWRANYEVCGGAKQQRMEYAEYTATLYHTLFD